MVAILTVCSAQTAFSQTTQDVQCVRIEIKNPETAPADGVLLCGHNDFLGGIVQKLIAAGYIVLVDRQVLIDELKAIGIPKVEWHYNQTAYLRDCLSQNTLTPKDSKPAVGLWPSPDLYGNPKFKLAPTNPLPNEISMRLSTAWTRTEQFMQAGHQVTYIYPDVTVEVLCAGKRLVSQRINQKLSSSYNAAGSLEASITQTIALDAFEMLQRATSAAKFGKEKLRTR